MDILHNIPLLINIAHLNIEYSNVGNLSYNLYMVIHINSIGMINGNSNVRGILIYMSHCEDIINVGMIGNKRGSCIGRLNIVSYILCKYIVYVFIMLNCNYCYWWYQYNLMDITIHTYVQINIIYHLYLYYYHYC